MKIDGRSLRKLCKLGRVQTYSKPTEILYEGHVPLAAYLVLEGEINLLKNRKVISKATAKIVIGVKELLSAIPSRLSAVATKNTRVCFLDRSMILSIIQEDKTKLASFFQELRDN